MFVFKQTPSLKSREGGQKEANVEKKMGTLLKICSFLALPSTLASPFLQHKRVQYRSHFHQSSIEPQKQYGCKSPGPYMGEPSSCTETKSPLKSISLYILLKDRSHRPQAAAPAGQQPSSVPNVTDRPLFCSSVNKNKTQDLQVIAPCNLGEHFQYKFPVTQSSLNYVV